MKSRPSAVPKGPPPSSPATGRFFRLTYSNAAPDDEPKLFQARDGIAFNELTAPLPACGYEIWHHHSFLPG
jgi:hypothetical protein